MSIASFLNCSLVIYLKTISILIKLFNFTIDNNETLIINIININNDIYDLDML